MRYPVRSSRESLQSATNGLPRLNINTTTGSNGMTSPLSPSGRVNGLPTTSSPARRGAHVPISPGSTGTRPEDKPDSQEYKKKQAMLTGPLLVMDYDNSASYDMPESLFTSLKDIFEAIAAHQSRVGVVSPQKFLEVLKRENEMFRTSMHQDAHEFLNLLLNEVVANVEAHSRRQEMNLLDINKRPSDFLPTMMTSTLEAQSVSKPPSAAGWVHELFEGTLVSETKCLTCENTSSRDEPFLDLSVDLENHCSVTACLRKFSEEEMLCGRNKFDCEKCGGLQEAERRIMIKRLPRILALHLKRFQYTEDQQRLQKLFHVVSYTFQLRLFNTTDDCEDPDQLYSLYAVVVHIGGGPYHGHYVSIIKTPDRGWMLFDDELVEPVDKSFVENFFGDRPGLACAYVLFYEQTTLEEVQREQWAEGLAREEAYQAKRTELLAKWASSQANGAHGALHKHFIKRVSKN